MSDFSTSLPSPSPFPTTADDWSPRDERGFSLFGMTPEHTADYIDHCNREEALEAGRREVEAEIDRDYIARNEARDRAADAGRNVLQARPSDPLETLNEAVAELEATPAAEPIAPPAAVSTPYTRLHADVMGALFGK